MKKIKIWLSSSTRNKVIFDCGIVALVVIICAASFFIYKKAIKHEHTVDYKFESLNDGTHNKTSYCTDEDGKKCKGFESETATEECEFDKDGICKYCGYSKYVTVKFINNVDNKIIKEEKFEKGYALDFEKDFPEPEEIEGYEFSRYDGNFSDLKADTTITLLYNPIGEEKKEETSTDNNIDNNSGNNSSSSNNSNSGTSDPNDTENYDHNLDPNYAEAHAESERFMSLNAPIMDKSFELAHSLGCLIQDCQVSREYSPGYYSVTVTVTAPDGRSASDIIYAN